MKLMIKIMNLFLTFNKHLQQKLWTIIMICTYKLMFHYWLKTFRIDFKLDSVHSLYIHGYIWDAMLSALMFT